MTVILNAVLGCAAGLSLAATAKEPLKTAQYPSRTRYFAATAIYSGAALVPSGLALYLLYPDWSLMYVANPAMLPAPIMIPVVIALCFGAPILGFFVAQRLIVAHRARAIRRALIALLALGMMIIGLGFGALTRVGYYEAYHYGGEMIPLAKSPVIVALAIILPALGAVFGYTRRTIRRHIYAIAHVDEDGRGKASG